MRVRVLTPTLDYASYVDAELQYDESPDAPATGFLSTGSYGSPNKIDFYISGFSGYYWCYVSNYKYNTEQFLTFPQKDIYLFINHVSKPIDITVTTTVKYLNFDS